MCLLSVSQLIFYNCILPLFVSRSVSCTVLALVSLFNRYTSDLPVVSTFSTLLPVQTYMNNLSLFFTCLFLTFIRGGRHSSQSSLRDNSVILIMRRLIGALHRLKEQHKSQTLTILNAVTRAIRRHLINSVSFLMIYRQSGLWIAYPHGTDVGANRPDNCVAFSLRCSVNSFSASEWAGPVPTWLCCFTKFFRQKCTSDLNFASICILWHSSLCLRLFQCANVGVEIVF